MFGVALALVPVYASPAVASEVRAAKSEGQVHTYVVELREGDASGLESVTSELARQYSAQIRFVYRYALKGFAATMTAGNARALRQDRRVRLVEEDKLVSADAVQSGPPWGLDRIDQRDLPLDSTFSYVSSGDGVHVYVIDTGIRTTHDEFGGRASYAYDVVDDGWNGDDCDGHGTHVAGTIGGSTYGVAKAVSLYSVRVLDCDGSGYVSGVIAGVDWVTGNHISPAVANMSLGSDYDQALNDAVTNSVEAGVVYAVAAGNDYGDDACDYSPASASGTITVGASDSSDYEADFSNDGSCVDLFGPGVDVESAYNSDDSATAVMNGTSMATPHVAGVAALYLEEHPGAAASEVRDVIIDNATSGRLFNLGWDSPDALLYSGFVVPPAVFDLTVSKAGSGSGTIGSSPAGIDCGSTCSGSFSSGTVVTSTATPDADSNFTGWSEDCSGTGECSVTMDQARSVSATFTLKTHAFTVTKTGSGSGTVASDPGGIDCGATCTANFDHGTPVTLSASPAANSTFTGWSGACSGTGDCEVAVDRARDVTSTFTLKTYALSVTKAGPGSGTVMSTPSGISCGSTCRARFDHGAVVTLSALPGSSSTFTGWGGACSGTADCQVTLDQARAVTATFTRPTAALATPTAIRSPVAVTFSEPVMDLSTANAVLRVKATATNLGAGLACKDAADVAVDCLSGPVTKAYLTPTSPLTPGQRYTATINPADVTPATDADDNAVETTSVDFRASTSEQESSSAATYAWRSVKNSSAHGGYYSTERLAGASATFAFTGTSVTWYTMTGPDQGKATVYIDGKSKATYSLYASKTTYKVAKAYSGLSSGAHTIRILVLGKKGSSKATDTLVAVDAFKVGGTLTTNPKPSYGWRGVSDSKASGARYATSNLAGTATSFKFRGTGIRWATLLGPTQGKATIYIDGKAKVAVDNYASAAKYGYLRSVTGLSDAVHTVKIVVLGQKNSKSSGTYVAVDRWVVG